jgi:hypothetical protein
VTHLKARDCQHEWSEDYTCTLCCAIKYASAPMWAACTKMSGGPRGVWLAIWTCADRDTTSPDEVYPSNERIGERAGGVSARSVQRHLEQLELDGWIRVTERKGRRYIRLAWAQPRDDWKVMAACEAAARARDRIVAGRDNIVASPDESDSATILSPDTTISSPHATGSSPAPDNIVTHTYHDLGSTLDEHLVPRERGGEPAPIEGHPCTVADSPEVTPARIDSPPARPRKRKAAAPKPGQTAFAIPDPPERDLVAELLEAHRLARANADVSEPAWPAKTSKRWASMRAGCRKAIEVHGFAWCSAMLEWRAAVWARDPSQHAYSTVDVWRPACLDYAKRNMSAGQAQARASPSRRDPAPLSCEPSGLQMPRIVIDPNAKCL